MKILLWIRSRRQKLRLAALVLMLVSLAGPWTFTTDGVPPPEWCSEPHFLTDKDRCVDWVSGLTMLRFIIFGFFGSLAGVLTGNDPLASKSREFRWAFMILGMAILIILPLAGTVLRVLNEKNKRMKLAYRISLVLAIPVAMLIIFQNLSLIPPIRLWGAWTFSFLAAIALLLDLVGEKRIPA